MGCLNSKQNYVEPVDFVGTRGTYKCNSKSKNVFAMKYSPLSHEEEYRFLNDVRAILYLDTSQDKISEQSDHVLNPDQEALLQCLEKDVNYRFHTERGNDAVFKIPPWFDVTKPFPRSRLETDFRENAAGWMRVPSFGKISQEVANQYYHEAIARQSWLLTKVTPGTVPLDEMPLGVVAREVLAEGQNPLHNSRHPLTRKLLNNRWASIAEHFATAYKLNANDIKQRLINWAQKMESDWMEFQKLVSNDGNST